MSDRLTTAGEALVRRLTTRDTQDNRPYEATIRAIEAEAAARAVDEALSVERVAEALHATGICGEDPWPDCRPSLHETDAAALVAHLRGPR